MVRFRVLFFVFCVETGCSMVWWVCTFEARARLWFEAALRFYLNSSLVSAYPAVGVVGTVFDFAIPSPPPPSPCNCRAPTPLCLSPALSPVTRCG